MLYIHVGMLLYAIVCTHENIMRMNSAEFLLTPYVTSLSLLQWQITSVPYKINKSVIFINQAICFRYDVI